MAELRVELRRPAGDVEHRERAALQQRQAGLEYIVGHDLRTVGAGVDVAVRADLVAAPAHVQLESVERLTAEGLADAIGEGVLRVASDSTLHRMPVSDGGPGLLDAIAETTLANITAALVDGAPVNVVGH